MTSTELLEARKTKANISFVEWLAFLDTAALTARFQGRIAAVTGAECWQDYYDDGHTPAEALNQELRYTP